ncbi:MAG: ferrous iron transport protein A [Clostridiales bacterium]|nr:ferrous iron transport protein A [Clostridiales bacterium]
MSRSLSNLKNGEKSDVASVKATGYARRRLQCLGITGGATVECVQRSVSGEISAYLVKDTVIALRSEDAADVIIQ